MIAVFNYIVLKSARLCKLHNLAFLVLIILGCNKKEDKEIKIVWIDNKASAIYLPGNLFEKIPQDSISAFTKISLLNDKTSTAILGALQVKNNIIFQPLLPFSRGSAYEVFYKNKKLAEFNIPLADTKEAPEISAIYPRQDTVPENILKLYLAFSHPMSEGHSDKYITLIKNNRDTLTDEFLNLQPELWNEDRTVLTLWFDPGRIKRDLQPNLRLGAPLKASAHYRLIISHNWKDAQGTALQKDFIKDFITSRRDSLPPDVNKWKVLSPAAGSIDPLIINTNEALDHYLFAESLQLRNEHDAVIKGSFEPDDNDKTCRFIPADKWVNGNYKLIIQSRLEDQAGNNLNRPFDRDIATTKEVVARDFYKIDFKIGGKAL